MVKDISTTYFEELWRFLRGDMSNSEFEEFLYGNRAFEAYLGEDLYQEAIANAYSNEITTRLLKENLRKFLRKNHPTECKCIELRNFSIFEEAHIETKDIDPECPCEICFNDRIEELVKTLGEVGKRKKPDDWVSLMRCYKCAQYWLMANERNTGNVLCIFRLSFEQVEVVLEKNLWPKEFDNYDAFVERLSIKLIAE